MSWCILFIEFTYNDSLQRGSFFSKNCLPAATNATEGFQATSRDVSKSGLKQVVLLGGLSCLPGPLAVSSVKNNWKKAWKKLCWCWFIIFICIYIYVYIYMEYNILSVTRMDGKKIKWKVLILKATVDTNLSGQGMHCIYIYSCLLASFVKTWFSRCPATPGQRS